MAERKGLASDLKAPEAQVVPSLTPREKKKKILLLLGGLIAFNAFVFGALYLSVFKAEQKAGGIVSKIATSNVTPTPFPFQEMTIPALRERGYSSSLGEREEVSANAEYTSYLTSYDSDGYRVNGLLTIPAGQEPEGGWPAIVFVHGYIPPSVYTTLGNYSDYVDYLARNGYVVFKIDLRGHADSEGEAGGGYYGSDYIVDTLNARSALQNSGFVNKDKIGLWGHSMAGNVITRSLAARPEIPAVAVWGGAVYTYEDMQKYGIDDNSYRPPSDQNINRSRRQKLRDAYGEFDKNHFFWKQVPFTNYLEGIKGAISLHHAVNDDVVDIGYSRDLDKILDKTSIPHELHEYSTGGHNITDGAFVEAMQDTVAFYDKYLK
jgi:uncharacterized protein